MINGGLINGLMRSAGLLILLVVWPSTASRVYLDVAVGARPLGRLVFALDAGSPLTATVANVRLLCSGEKTSLDASLTFLGCAFEHSPSYVEGAQYKWSHVLKGNGRNAVGRPRDRLDERAALARCTHSCFGGCYYGMELPSEGAPASVLTVPVAGPGSGYTRIAIVRVRDSPPQWREQLLLNSAVLGALQPESEPVLLEMARAEAPPVVVGCGVLPPAEASSL